MAQNANFTTPVGRLVMGSLYKPQTTDAEGKPLVNKSGPNAGQPKVQYFFAVAIPKGTEQHWSQTQWGAEIWKCGHEAFPQAAASPQFAWKIVDGDSAVPNRRGITPVSREGYRGNWVISFTSGFAPKIYNRDGSAAIVEPDAVKLGYYVQVNANVAGNGSQQQPGVFINHSMVALSAFGEEISVGADPTSAGFGAAPLPAGASATPLAGFVPPVAAVSSSVAAVPAYAPPPAAAPANHAFLAIPPVPGAPVATPPAPVKVMLPAANGASYDQMLAAGWTDALMIQHGMLAA